MTIRRGGLEVEDMVALGSLGRCPYLSRRGEHHSAPLICARYYDNPVLSSYNPLLQVPFAFLFFFIFFALFLRLNLPTHSPPLSDN